MSNELNGKVVGVGNCQLEGIIRCASNALGTEARYIHARTAADDPKQLADALIQAEVAFATVGPLAAKVRHVADQAGRPDLPVLATPKFHFIGYHPDVAYPHNSSGERPELPLGNANSAILLAAWRDGLGAEEALSLFRDEVYDALGYYRAFDVASEMLLKECEMAGFDARPCLDEWVANGPFVYIPFHPKIEVLRDLALRQLQTAGLLNGSVPSVVLRDEFAHNLTWPVYPDIAARLGIGGDYIFRPKNSKRNASIDAAPLSLENFIERTFACYERSPPDFGSFMRLNNPLFDNIRRFLRRNIAGRQSHPYKNLQWFNWWSKSVAEPAFHEVDPVSGAKFTIGRNDRVATAGSCFAQHIARRLAKEDFHYLVTEKAPPHCADPTGEDYGVFPTRSGNIYTVRQLLQLADRAYGRFKPRIDAWEIPEGGFVDPFRPRIGGAPFGSLQELRAARETHFEAVRAMFESADVFVFTLGLTEAWWSKDDQAVVPLAPGVLNAKVPPDAYVPKNFTAMEVLADLQQLIGLFQQINPQVRILLTVSPVPMVATFEDEHVLSATTYSKSVLRVAAGEIAKSYAHVDYFPSYEIVMGSFSRGRYFANDLRQVTSDGVDHVMKCFLRHYTSGPAKELQQPSASEGLRAEINEAMEVICDEEEIAKSALR